MGYVPKISVLMPTFNGIRTLPDTLSSLQQQTFEDFELIICDDLSSDGTYELVSSYTDVRFKCYQNKENVGYPKNLMQTYYKSTTDYIFLLAQDDIIFKHTLEKTVQIFDGFPDILAITRPYFWFENNLQNPIRLKSRLENQGPQDDKLLNIKSNNSEILTYVKSLDQLSGLALKKYRPDLAFSSSIFPAHSIPFMQAIKDGSVMFISEFNTGVRSESSQSRNLSSIYDESPVQSWVEAIDLVFDSSDLSSLNNYLKINLCAYNFVGLIQIRNFSRHPLRFLLREVQLMYKIRKQIVFKPAFLLIVFFLVIFPRKMTIFVTDLFKRRVLKYSFKMYDYVNVE
jgi:glycosyltransferase involved in cell wall biosynthesis